MEKQSGTTLYLECQSGISGDMMVGALLDLGADEEVLKKALESIPVQGFAIRISRVKKSGLDCCDFNVILDEKHENHDHDMEYLHGHEKKGNNEHDVGDCHHHCHEHRKLSDIYTILQETDMTDSARKHAVHIFDILADAESKAHGISREQVHFHEVGAVDSIVDIVAAGICLDNLKVEKCIVPFLCEGQGTVRCQHGILPVPVPAVANIALEHHLKLHITEESGEFVTPTGAAIAAAIRTSEELPERFSIHAIGLGAGKRKYNRPGFLRAMLLEEQTA